MLSDLRFYISEIELLGASGETTRLKLHEDIPWQQADLALIDLEDGQGTCANGTSETTAYLVGSVPPGEYRGLRFTVGVPFERNHADPLSAAPPLDDPAMHWHWRSGYKFMRAGIKTAGDGFWIHVGSAGCTGTVGDIDSCRFPNRAAVALTEFRPNRDRVALDLKSFFSDVDFDDGEATDCSSAPGETACIAPFAALGIDSDDGSRTRGQRVFSVAR
jgi:uncharacterized repeat protein (TIGR04052 family)